MPKTATFIKLISPKQALFKLSVPIKYVVDYDVDKNYKPIFKTTSYVISSMAAVYYETYLFPSNKNGDITCWSELAGSEKEIYNFTKPLENIGYKVLKANNINVLYNERLK